MRRVLLVAIAICATIHAFAEYKPTSQVLGAREEFRDAKFGMFIHWGVYSLIGRGEWVQNNEKIPIAEYEKLPPKFNPVEFNAKEWVSTAKKAGMKYITFTSKHHDGFAMFDSKVTDWDILDKTPYQRDIVKELARECRKQGLKFFCYYSHLDWHHPEFFPRGGTGKLQGRPESGDWNKYMDFMNAQIKELCTRYGPIAGIWFDGVWDRPDAAWDLQKTYGIIHKYQPAALVGNNHHKKAGPGEDIQLWERDLPGKSDAGFSKGQELSPEIPLETCDTLNGAWGYAKDDKNFKSKRDVVHYLVRAAGNNANLLLNVGPMPDGRLQPEAVEKLKQVGKWMRQCGGTVYGTRGGPVSAQPWGVTTQDPRNIFVHVLASDKLTTASDGKGKLVELNMPEKITLGAVREYVTDRKLKTETSGTTLLVTLPKEVLNDVDTILVIQKRT